MSLEERNLAFNNVVHVTPEFAGKKTEEWTAATARLRAQHPQHLDLAYGPKERNTWDIYPAPNPRAPCLVHIHGGYWQRGSKETFGCLTEGALARGGLPQCRGTRSRLMPASRRSQTSCGQRSTGWLRTVGNMVLQDRPLSLAGLLAGTLRRSY
jgi:hypothetical protein